MGAGPAGDGKHTPPRPPCPRAPTPRRSTNVANYQPIGSLCPTWDWCLPNNGHGSDPCCADPCALASQYNGAVNEHQYAATLTHFFSAAGFQPQVVIDTGRSGVANMRSECANWCNIRGRYARVLPNWCRTCVAPDLHWPHASLARTPACVCVLPRVCSGAGQVPTTNTSAPTIDAYMWLKTPGGRGCAAWGWE